MIAEVLDKLANWKSFLVKEALVLADPLIPDPTIHAAKESPLDDQALACSAAGSGVKRKRAASPRALKRLAALGDNPRERRKLFRASHDSGYYIAISPKQSRRTLYKLGSCFMVLGVDYVKYTYSGLTMPDSADFDTVCKVCTTKSKVQNRADSDASDTSSFTCVGD